MRFQFCGGLDCPDWVLSEILTLSKLTSIKIRMLCNQAVEDLTKKSCDYEKIKKITKDLNVSDEEVKACFAGLCFIIASAARNNLDRETLDRELQQLGFLFAMFKATKQSFIM